MRIWRCQHIQYDSDNDIDTDESSLSARGHANTLFRSCKDWIQGRLQSGSSNMQNTLINKRIWIYQYLPHATDNYTDAEEKIITRGQSNMIVEILQRLNSIGGEISLLKYGIEIAFKMRIYDAHIKHHEQMWISSQPKCY